MGNGKRWRITAFGLFLGALSVTMLVSCPAVPEDIGVNKNCTVTFDTHGGSQILPKYFVEGSEFYPHSFTSDKNGCLFAGWFDAESGGTRYGGAAGTEKITADRDMVLHAQWHINRRIRFNVGGGEPVPDMNIPDGLIFDPAHFYASYPGWGFDGWWTTPDTSGVRVLDPFAVTGDIVLYAHWSSNSRTVSFKTYGGSPVHAISVPNNNLLDLSPYRSEWQHESGGGWYAFDGWYNAPEGGTKYSSSIYVANDFILHAQWIFLGEDT
jgi:uncharacterized repeat protein (TIGR02543 family)